MKTMSMDYERKILLIGFLKYIGFNRKKIMQEDIDNRIKVQKLVYFGKALGLPLDYDFNLYLYGPYSSGLTKDYFNISDEEWANGKIDIPANVSDLLKQLKGRDALFLEIAATLHSIKTANPDASEDLLINIVTDIKSERLNGKSEAHKYVRDTFNFLKKVKLL
ncbi:YwgA family protein [Thermoplasma acidophilum]|nr:YwgA family protein [Thermoplasma acidophilum]